jgi:hypothetical protein
MLSLQALAVGAALLIYHQLVQLFADLQVEGASCCILWLAHDACTAIAAWPAAREWLVAKGGPN